MIEDKLASLTQENSFNNSLTTTYTNYSSEFSELLPICTDEQLQTIEEKLKCKDIALKTYLVSKIYVL